MAWRKLPPRLEGRVPRVGLGVALIGFAGTLGAGILWLAGPPVLLAILIGDERYILAAILAPAVAWWLYRMLREPLIPGLLLAAPVSLWSVVQQQRGMVNTLDLESGRLVGLLEWRGLTPAERDVLRFLVRQVDDLPELAAQIDHCEVMAECVCGCASIRLYATAPSVPRDAARGNAQGERDHLDISAVGTDSEGRAIDVVLHVTLGSMRELEVTAGGVHDGTADELPAVATLRPTGVRRTRMHYG
jgi:hypothetical protein